MRDPTSGRSRKRALKIQRLGGRNEVRGTEQRPLWLELIGDACVGEARLDCRDQPDFHLLAHVKKFRFYSPWASEHLQGVKWEAVLSDF